MAASTKISQAVEEGMKEFSASHLALGSTVVFFGKMGVVHRFIGFNKTYIIGFSLVVFNGV
jgi:hypothetical protein